MVSVIITLTRFPISFFSAKFFSIFFQNENCWKKVMQLIKEIPSEKAALAARLQTLADNYQFDEIVKLLNISEF